MSLKSRCTRQIDFCRLDDNFEYKLEGLKLLNLSPHHLSPALTDPGDLDPTSGDVGSRIHLREVLQGPTCELNPTLAAITPSTYNSVSTPQRTSIKCLTLTFVRRGVPTSSKNSPTRG